MEWQLVMKQLIWGLVVLVQMSGYRGCFEEERRGLLQFKDFLTSNTTAGTVHDLLPSWVVDDTTKSSDCCRWERVTCNSTSGHVIDLSLDDINQISSIDGGEGDADLWIWLEADQIRLLNVSPFSVFTELRSLNLSFNIFGGWVENEGFESLSRLKKLESLDLGYNKFNRSIIQSLSALTSLKTLILKYNHLDGSFPAQELSVFKNLKMLDLEYSGLNGSLTMQGFDSLSRLKKLKTLDLSYNHFNRSIIQPLTALISLENLILKGNLLEGSFLAQEMANLRTLKVLILRGNRLNDTLPIQDLATFDNLEILDLSINTFIGSVPPSIKALSSLKALSLSWNYLNGSLSSQGLCELKKLVELDLSFNQFEGNLPPCLMNLTSLQFLDLFKNQFTGEVSSSLLAGLTSLRYIDLGYNQFEGLFSFNSFANNSKLKFVRFISESNKFEIEIENSSWVPLFQLEVLVLSYCSLVEVPIFLFHQYNLRVADLSNNKLKGQFPGWLLENNTRLDCLNLRNNSFSGQFYQPTTLNLHLSISWLDVSLNQFDGQLEENIGKILPNIKRLYLSNNAFEGSIPSSIGDMSGIEKLDMSFNKFSGEVPTELFSDCINLKVLWLSNNSFRGHFFSNQFNLTNLLQLKLDNNQFFGTLPNVVSKFSALSYLDVSNNYMSGKIPCSWIGNLTNLYTLALRNNFFRGQFRCEKISLNFNFLDLSHNFLSGSLPSLSSEELGHIHLASNTFTGSIPKAFLNVSTLLTLDIRFNKLSGKLPSIIGALSELRILLLKGNSLSDIIPTQLCQLNKIQLMDLSENFFSGSIPHCFQNISSSDYMRWCWECKSFRPITWDVHYVCGSLLEKCFELVDPNPAFNKLEEVEFVTKYRPYSYKGVILSIMYGLDLSCNNLTGEIPHELGNLYGIHGLNLSHNQLTGPIPQTFSNLTQVESLDLSYNNLSGDIPLKLIELNFLAVFSVAYNNLSGKIPNRKQFGTFDASSYEGNPFLCGSPLEKNCTRVDDHDSPPPPVSDEKWYEIDLVVFFASFSVSFLIFFFGVVTILYVNPYWQQRSFNMIKDLIYTCYYFVVDTLRKLLAHFYN